MKCHREQSDFITFIIDPGQVSRVLGHIGEPLAPAWVAVDWVDDGLMMEDVDPGAHARLHDFRAAIGLHERC